MSLFRDSLRPPPLASDEAIRRYLLAIRAELEPDPLFRRRLRGIVVNRFVAAREGVQRSGRGGSAMGKLGRACLYASVALAMSVGGVLAASRGALPGDLLYSVKLEMEQLRVAILPAHLHDDLAVARLSERINEFSLLADAGDWQHAAGLASAISDGYDELAVLGVTDFAAEGMLAQRLEVLESLVDQLPPRAEAAIKRAMEHAPGLNGTAPGRGDHRTNASGVGSRAPEAPNSGRNGFAAGSGDDQSEPPPRRVLSAPTARPTASARPSHGSSEPSSGD